MSMPPTVVPPCPGVRSLTELWNAARLRADDAKSTSVRPAPGGVSWRAALEAVLTVGNGVQTQCRYVDGVWEQVRWRTTPSAGALYPFEVVACIVGHGSFAWHVEAGRLLDCGLPAFTPEDVRAAGLVTRQDHRPEALLVVLARPWLGMNKYRQRGYQYCHLDVGHVTTNVALYATALGYAPIVHLRFSRAYLTDRLGLQGLCREPVAVLSFARAGLETMREAPVIIARDEDAPPMHPELPDHRERENWESLREMVSLDAETEQPCAPASAPLVREPAGPPIDGRLSLPDGLPALSTATECCSAMLTRRSAKGFHDRPLSVGQIGGLLSALRADGLSSDCAAASPSRLGVRVVARHVDGMNGVFAYAPGEHALDRIDTQVDDLHAACMKQRTAVGAAALLLFHASGDRLLDGYASFAETHFHAGQLGQRLHLAATRLRGLGMTCIGGFDGERCAALARLEPGDEAVYVILLGVPDESGVKHDRLRVAYSHGYTTEEG